MNNFTKVFFETKSKLNSKGVLFFFFMLLTMQSGWAQTTAVSITTSSTITDNVGSYAGTAGTVPTYWGQQGSLANGTNQAGTNQSGGTAGGWYGSGTTNNGGMSFLGSKTATNGNATLAYQNNTGSTITGFTLAYTAKMFNNGSGSPTVSVSWSSANTLAVQTQGALTNNLASLAFSDATANISTGVTLTQTVSSITIANGQYVYIRWINTGGSNSDNLGWNAIAFTPTFAASSPTAVLADNGTQISAASLSGGTTNTVLHKSQVTVANGPVSLTGMGCTTTGTYASSDITNLKVWYQTTSTFSSGSATLLSTYTTPGVAAAKTFPSFTTQSLPTGTGYLFITADIATGATVGNTITLSALTPSNLTITSVTPTGSTTVGGTQTFLTNYYWNGGTIATNPAAGGSGTWDTASSWRVGTTSGAQATWAANNAAILAGTAGTIDLGTSDQTAASIAVNTTGYTLTSSSLTTKTLTGPITLANSVNLNLNSNVSGGLTLGSITGGTSSSLTLTGANTATTDAQRINLISGAVIAASTPITISTTGSKGLSGFVNPGSGISTINATIANSSGTPTMLGAVSGGTLTIGGLVSGTSGVQFSAGTSTGSGTVNMNVAGTWSGPTYFNGGNTGTIKLGIANGISTNSDVTMGYTSTFGQVLDLNGFSQTFKSLASVSGGTGSITNNATATTSTLTINQSSNTSFGLPITNGGSGKIIALTKSGAGTLTMTGTHTFTGATTITGGYIAANNESSINGAGTSIVLNGGGIASTGSINFNTVGRTISLGTSGANFDATGGQITLTNPMTLSGANATVSLIGGTLKMGANSIFPTTSSGVTLALGTVSGTQIDLNSANQTVASLTGGAATGGNIINTTGTATLTLGNTTANTSSTFAGVIGSGGGTINVVKQASGTVTLSGTNTYTGTTSINAGTLQITGSLASGSAVTVASGATLAGTGSVGGAITLNGIISPNTSGSIGTLTTGNLALGAGGTYYIDINDIPANGTAGTNWDKIIAGTVTNTATSGSNFTVSLNGTIASFSNSTSYSWAIGTYTGTAPSASNIAVNTTGLTNALAGGTFSITFTSNTINLVFTPLPVCVAPVTQASSLILTPSSTTISGSFTAASGTPSGYLVVRTTTSAAPSSPSSGTVYSIGSTLLGASTYVEYVGALTTFTSGTVSSNTQYWYWVYDYNNTNCSGGPMYNTSAPLTTTTTTLVAPIVLAAWDFSTNSAAALAASTTNSNITVGSLTKGSSGTYYSVSSGPARWGMNGVSSTTTQSGAVTAGSYLYFTMQPKAGYAVSLNAIPAFGVYSSGSGPASEQMQYSTDGSSYTNVGNTESTLSTSNPIGAITLSSIPSLQNVTLGTTITFRMLMYNGGIGAGGFYDYDTATNANDFIVNGYVTCIVPSVPSASNLTTTYNGVAKNVTASVGSNTTIDWYDAPTGGTKLVTGALTSPSNTNQGTYTYYAEARNTVCGSVSTSRTQVIITISKALLTVTAAANTKTYDGSLTATATPTITSGALGTGDTAVYSETYDTKNQGSGKTITPAVVSIKNASNVDVSGNYTVTLTPVATGIINKATVTVTAVAATKTYDGTTSSSGVPTIGTLISGDVINTNPTQVFDTSNYGTSHVLTASGLTIKDALNADMTGNYTITYTDSPATGVINKLSITVTPTASQTKNYGALDPVYSYSVSPAVPLTGLLNRATGESVGTYSYTLGTLSAGTNYSLALSGGVTFAIMPTAVIVSNNSPICSGNNATFSLSGSTNALISYTINGVSHTVTLSNGAATLSVTGAVATQNLVLVSVSENSLSQTISDTSTVNIVALTTATNTSSQSICSAGKVTLLGNVPTDGTGLWSVVSGPSSLTSQFSDTSLAGATFTPAGGAGDYVIRWTITNATCSSSADATITVGTGNSTTWNNGSWTNGAPTSMSTALISSNYTATSNITACSLRVSANAVVVIPSGYNVTLNGALTVDSGSSFTIENNSNLIQTGTTNANSGAITIKRDSSLLFRLDYTLWSAPVAGQNLVLFSPLTSVSPSRFYTYNTATDLYNSITPPSASTFDAGKGYLIRMPNTWVDHVLYPSSPALAWTGIFKGVPNNGNINVSLSTTGNGYNAVGNPYPSPLNFANFIANNQANIEGTVYFWRKTNDGNNNKSYSTCTTAGCTINNGHTYSDYNFIASGQGFIVKAKSSVLNFTNAMRSSNNVNEFFRTAVVDRFWLELTNAAKVSFGKKLLAYIPEATLGYDNGLDGLYINDSKTALLSMIDNNELVIQARPAFTAEDSVPLVFKTDTADAYTITLQQVEGIFNGSQDIFLKDNLTNSTHDFKTGSYTFTTDVGTFNNRFEIVYQNALAVQQPLFNDTSVVVYKQNNELIINSGNTSMTNVKVYDSRGRLLMEQNKINASQAKFYTGTTNEILIVKITSDTLGTVTKKVIN